LLFYLEKTLMFCTFVAYYQLITMSTKDIKVERKVTQLISHSSEHPVEKSQTESESHRIASCIPRTIKRYFPNLLSLFSQLPDTRKAQGRKYLIEEMLMGGLSMFLFKTGSRNSINNLREDGYFHENYRRLFGLRLPHQDCVADMLCSLPAEHLEQVKMDLMSKLFEQKWLRKSRLLDKYYMIVVDATGVMSFDKPHCEHCLTKKTNNGKKTIYFHYVLEAKLVTRDGLALSLASEWIENPTGEFDKQDCERKAFIRLVAKLKKQYPRLQICILADGLYPYENAFKVCEANGWKYIFVLQDKSLKTVQQEVDLTRRKEPVKCFYTANKGWRIRDDYRFQTGIDYHNKYSLNWVQCIETRNKMTQQGKKKTCSSQSLLSPQQSCFEYVTNILVDRDNVKDIAAAGRLRWKIENEGFNTQKCGDYELEHKYCQTSYNGLKNYYNLLQIAHAINQLIEKGNGITRILRLRPKESLHNLWCKLKGFLIFCRLIINYHSPEFDISLWPAPT